MKVAIFDNEKEVIVLAVKGRKKDKSAIDGFDEWFTNASRDVDDYNVTLAHIGDGEGLCITSKVKTEITSAEKDVAYWFESFEDWKQCETC